MATAFLQGWSRVRTRYYEKSSWWSKRGIKPRISEMRAFHALTTQYHNASITGLKSHESKKNKEKRWRPVCDRHYQLTCIPAGVTAKLKHIGGVFVALVPCCPIITIGISVIAFVIFNKLQSCGDRKGYILV